MNTSTQLSNPFSTGGGGSHFEAHVQASFVALMLTGGHAPCLPCWPIVEIKLQAKIDGFETDDLVVFVEDPGTKEQRRLLGQVKRSIAITKSDNPFKEFIQAAWNDFNNSSVFKKNKDIIALMTGPLSETDTRNVLWLLEQARHTKDANEFFMHVRRVKFSPPESTKKLEIIRCHLKVANQEREIENETLYDFLKHFHLLSYDLDREHGVVLSLLHSHISQFHQQYPQWVWPRIVNIVQMRNCSAGTITRDSLPEDLLEVFKSKPVMEMPEELKTPQEISRINRVQPSDETYLALATLIGSWNENNQSDCDVIAQLLDINYGEWLNKAREILHFSDSPLSLKNGIWKVINRSELWSQLGSRILDQNLEGFKSLALSILKEPNPAFELPAEERYAASIHGKVLKYSDVLRQGIAEGLAILANMSNACSNCSQGRVKTVCSEILRTILSNADWVLWGSLNSLLPALAEVGPNQFLYAVEKALRLTPYPSLHLTPCPFDKLFAQEGKGIFGDNYLTGLLWALEGLAWEKDYLVRVCVVLGELASHDPGGQYANRPANSLVTILLPWHPQTLASFDKRKVAVQTLLKERPEAAWNLTIQLLPSRHQTSFYSHKPKWRKTIPENWESNITDEEYWQQVSFYADLAISAAGHDTDRLSSLIDKFNNLPQSAFDKLIEVLASRTISTLPEEQRLLIWDHLTKFTNKHRKFSYTEWALPENLIVRIEHIAERLAPTNPLNRYQHLFTDDDSDLYEESGDWQEQEEKLNVRRDNAILEIFQQNGVENVIRFAESIVSPSRVGYALGIIDNDMIGQVLLPQFLDTPNNKRKALASGFIWRLYRVKNWEWLDNIDRSNWTPGQIGQFLAYLPFTKETWHRASGWLQEHEDEYWNRTSANPYQADGSLDAAIDKLIEHGRPGAAIQCLDRLRRNEQIIDTNQCVRALIAMLSSREPPHPMSRYHIIELIKFLQIDSSVNQEDLFRIEWEYLLLLNHDTGAKPQLLEYRLANYPEFFCKVIGYVYLSENEEQPSIRSTQEVQAIAENSWRLLDEWRTPPGTQQDGKDGTFSEECFKEWLQRVKQLSTESGHLEVALKHIGNVLIHAPVDSDGLWINRAVAGALNDRDAAAMREGFCIGKFNSRGAHSIDPTGKPEKELSKELKDKAEKIENAGFYRFATSLRDLANQYERDAER